MITNSRISLCIIVTLFSFSFAFCQDSTRIIGNAIQYNDKEYLPGVEIKAYNGKTLLDKTTSSFDGLIVFTVQNDFNKIVLSNSGFYSVIIENFNSVAIKDLNIGSVQFVENSYCCVRYATSKAKREDSKSSKQNIKELKKGLKITSNDKEYQMKLRRINQEFVFLIDYQDMQN